MEQTDLKPRWAPRVQQHKIRRLYLSDANGLLDEDLVMDVGIGLYLRCQSILKADDAANGRVHCPACDSIILLANPDATDLLRCEHCGWQMPWGKYRATYRHQELCAGGARPFFEEYIRNWEVAQTCRERWRLIDRLIHLWHWENRQDERGLGRPTGVNLIEGSRKQVIAFLDSLTYGGSAEAKQSWRKARETVAAAQRAGRERRPRSKEGNTQDGLAQSAGVSGGDPEPAQLL